MNKKYPSCVVCSARNAHVLAARSCLLLVCLLLAASFQSAHASLITTYYGDDDGFGVGATSGTMDPLVSNQNPGEEPLTDAQLISTAWEGVGAGCSPAECCSSRGSAICTSSIRAHLC